MRLTDECYIFRGHFKAYVHVLTYIFKGFYGSTKNLCNSVLYWFQIT